MTYPKTDEFLKQCAASFSFDESAGVFFKECTKGSHTWKEPAGSITAAGIRLTVANCYVMAHHVVWRMKRGEWPNYHIKHLNGDKFDNRPENLRAPTKEKQDKNNQGSFGSFLKSIGISDKQMNTIKVQKVREKLGDRAALEFAKEQGFIDTAEFNKRIKNLTN